MPTNPDFRETWCVFEEESVKSAYDGVLIHIMGKQSLIATKKASGHPQDLLDLTRLEQAHDTKPGQKKKS